MADATASGPEIKTTSPTPDTAPADGPMLAADGTPLKRSLARALRREKLRALALIAPLLIFILVTFIAPILDMLFRSVENQIVAETLPRTVIALQDYDHTTGEAPGEDAFAALYMDLFEAETFKVHTRLGTRLNYETTGVSSLFRKTGRGIGRMDTDVYTDQFQDLDPAWEDPGTWISLLGDAGAQSLLTDTASAWQSWERVVIEEEDELAEEEPADVIYTMLYRDLARLGPDGVASYGGAEADLLKSAAAAVDGFETVSIRDQFIDIEEDWGDTEVWATIQTFSPAYTSGYFLSAVDLQMTPSGIEQQPDDQKIYILLFQRTLFMSLVIMGSCILLGYPIAYLLSSLPLRTSNVLLILVLLPFWTSLLVRTSAWKVLLQQQGSSMTFLSGSGSWRMARVSS